MARHAAAAPPTPRQPAVATVLIPETIAPNTFDLAQLLGKMESQFVPGAAALASQHVRGLLRELEEVRAQLHIRNGSEAE